MHRWRQPSLSLHGIEGAFAEAGSKTVIPKTVIGKFSIRIVPNMEPDVVEKKVGIEIGKTFTLRTGSGEIKSPSFLRTKLFFRIKF